MKRNVLVAGTALALFLGSMSVFSVGQSQKAIKFRLGEIVETDFKPGLHFQFPFLNNVKKFDGRLLTLDSTPALFMTYEKKNVNVDYFVKWRIKEVAKFYTSVSGDVAQANLQLDRIVQSALRSEFSNRTIKEVVAEKRGEIRTNVIKAANELVNKKTGDGKSDKDTSNKVLGTDETRANATEADNRPAVGRADEGKSTPESTGKVSGADRVRSDTRPGRGETDERSVNETVAEGKPPVESNYKTSGAEEGVAENPAAATEGENPPINDKSDDVKPEKAVGNRGLGIEIVDIRIIRIDLPKEVSASVYRRMESERAGAAWSLRARGAELAERRRAEADREREVILGNAYRDAEIVRGEGDATAAEIYSKSYGKDKDFFAFHRSLAAYKQAFKNEGDTIVLEPNSEFFQYFKKSNK